MSIDVVVFDLDDTLIQTKKQSTKNAAYALKKYGIKVSMEALRKHCGVSTEYKQLDPWQDWILSAHPELGLEGIQEFNEFYLSLKDELPIYPAVDGAASCLKLVAACHYLILSTGRSSKWLGRRLEGAGIDKNLFSAVFSGEGKPRKPDPKFFDDLFGWTSKEEIKKEQCIYVGDHIYDAQGASSAGIRFVGVLGGIATRKQFQEVGVKRKNILPSVKLLPEYLRGDYRG